MSRTLEDPLFRNLEQELLGFDLSEEDTNLIVNAASELAKGGLKKVTAKPGTGTPSTNKQPQQQQPKKQSFLEQHAVPIAIGGITLVAVIGTMIYLARK